MVGNPEGMEMPFCSNKFRILVNDYS